MNRQLERLAKSSPTSKRRQIKLEGAANRILAKSGYFHKRGIAGVLPAEACGVHGLRPTWHGRAS